MERPWQSLVRELRDAGIESPYLERLRARHELRIHREAVGIRRNDVLDRDYLIPPRA